MKLLLFDEDGNEVLYNVSLWQSMKMYFMGGIGWCLIYIAILIIAGIAGLLG